MMRRKILTLIALLALLAASACAPDNDVSPLATPEGEQVSPVEPVEPLTPGETQTFRMVINWLLSGGVGYLVYRLLEHEGGVKLRERITQGLGLAPDLVGRGLAYTLTVGCSLAVYGVGMAFEFLPDPGSVAAWISLAFQLAGISFPTSQASHALRGK